MSGHSKWASIKHKKGAADAKRGKIFSKLAKEIVVAAKQGGGNTDTNARLRLVVQKARENNMPSDNVERAIKKGTGELPGVSYEEITYEGYAPGGVAVLVEALSDNRNRTTAEIRSVFDKKGGSLAGQGAVAWQFHKKGYIVVARSKAGEDALMTLALDAGAQDLATSEDSYEITTDPKDFEAVRKAVEAARIPVESAEITMVPQSTVKIAGDNARAVLALVEALEDLEDVQNVYANFDIPDTELKALSQG
jgi:YebC/PmpR family DNA-binding regulatory protein